MPETAAPQVPKELADEISKVVSANLKSVLSSALPSIAGGRTLRSIDLGDILSNADYRDTYKEGGGHNENYKDSYSETGYKDHYSDTRSTIFDRYRPDELTKDELLRQAEKLKAELAAKKSILDKLKSGGNQG